MRNILDIDLTNEKCDGVYSSDCGSNCAQLMLNVKGLGLTKPYLYFILPDGAIVQTGILDIENDIIGYEMPENILNNNGMITIILKEDNNGFESEAVRLEVVSYTEADILICKYTSSKFVFSLYSKPEESDKVKVSPTEPSGNEKVWIQKGKNLFNKNGLILANSRVDAGISGVYTQPDCFTSDYIEVLPNKPYSLQGINAYHIYDENKDKINQNFYDGDKNDIIATTWNTRYIRISTWDINKVMVSQGSTTTEYEEYVERKINVDGEEFLDVEKANAQQNYSTEEQVIGTWIDGKPIYRLVFTTEQIQYSYSHLNVDTIVNIDIKSYFDDILFTTGRKNNDTDFYTWFVNIHLKLIAIDIGNTWLPNYNYSRIILEYTKTTD